MSLNAFWKDRLGIAAVVIAGMLLLVDLLLPLGFDNDIYQSMGWTLYAYHGLPYLASWDHNFPGIVYVHALGIALFGNTDLGFRLTDTIFHIVIAALYYRLLRRWLSNWTAFTAVILLTLYYTGGVWDLVGQRDGYAVCFLLAGSLALFNARYRSGRHQTTTVQLLMLGICMSIAVLVRPTYGLFLLSSLVLVALFGQRLRNCIVFSLGCVIPLSLFLLPYVFVVGGLEQVYDSLIRFNIEMYSGTRVPINFFTHGRGVLYVLAALSLLPFIQRKKESLTTSPFQIFDRTWLILFSVSALLSPVIMGKFFIYHFEPFMVIIVAFSAIGLVNLVRLTKLPQRVALGIALLICVYVFYPRHLVGYYLRGLRTNSPLHYTYETVLSDSLTGLVAQEEVSRYLDRAIPSNATIEYPSFYLGLRWRSNRPQATRFTTPIALCIAKPDNTHPAFQAAWRKEFIDSLKDRRPAFVVLYTGERAWWPFINDYIDDAVHKLPGFRELLSERYTQDTVIRGFTLYRLRS